MRNEETSLKTAVVIINWNSGDLLQACVESLLATTTDAEFLVVDNASRDWSVDFLTEYRDRVRFVQHAENKGFAAAVNEAFFWTDTPYVLILNPDLRALPGSVRTLEEMMDCYPQAGAIGGYVGEKYLPRQFPTVRSLVLENLGVRPLPLAIERDLVSVDQVAGAAVMIRREAFQDVAGFDDRYYPAWYEDVDFCAKIKGMGWKVYFARRAEFIHSGGYSAGALGQEHFISVYYKNQVRFARKHFGSTGALVVRGSIVAGMIGRIIRRPWQPVGYAKALLGALGGW